MADQTLDTRTENADFLEYAYYRVWKANGASDEHARAVAYAVSFSDRAGKMNQGMGALENIDIVVQSKNLDMSTKPEIIAEGPSWATVDGHRTSGQYALTTMARIAIDKARESGIAIVFGGNHNDAGGFGAYTWMAYLEGMAAQSSNSTPPLAAPFGAMENKLPVPPWDGIMPSQDEPPVWMSTKLAEFYDADVASAYLQGKRLKGKWLIDPETGELSDDPKPYFVQLGDYGRVSDYTAAGQFENPRTYTQNLFSEGMNVIINPVAERLSAETPRIAEFLEPADAPSVSGSHFVAINPAAMGSMEDVLDKADRLARTVQESKPRPGKSVRMPGASAWKRLRQHGDEVRILANHWDPFWGIAKREGLSEEQLRRDYESADFESAFAD